MGAACCTEQFEKGGELDIKIVKLDNNQQQNGSGTASISKEFFDSKDKMQVQMGICYSCQVLKITCECKCIQKLNGDKDDEEIYMLSSRSLDSSSSESRPDDTNTKKTILKHQLHYVSNVQQFQIPIKKKVRFDLSKKQ
ncbi:unnamed protein product (macronuclear) [Paramecium tetraurelia]|uniref:Uncharacterized protein n=1 Tax=Paramecium tetraurelia TaxID=5888 RepID=A0CN81_PARTE|nr:uncharacterized protein GSPATT00008689001 [Paramecium tetraurelia]CAK72248.1 unnamed protein product [Paramecium tetraurelia]|eukprot:XP_001439645.1 hypothetical protein (macronuclear) [Paramecium tetraurelia strain d4-2]